MEQSIGQFNWVSGMEVLPPGQVHPLLEQLGTADGLALLNATSDALLGPKINSAENLGLFLSAYREQLLFPFELPAIVRAYHFASRHQTRELIALDRELARHPVREDFAQASRKVGQAQLQRLRPLRDHRVAQRYLDAVAQGQADGWHTLVYGLTLAIYSLPLRQGLLSYARQTLAGFVHTASGPLQLSERERQEILDIQSVDLPGALEKLMQAEHKLNSAGRNI